ncbi:hypothetical protein GCM10008967_27920 [Bacillus carboniphilus]|uniref:Uncharacterized protein n=1 Tax=Bacillus carboniphilus TaxID=86663 RepID=A0ABP3G8T1_9BACI
MVDIKVSKEKNDFKERELKLLEVLLLNLAAQANAQTIKEGMAMNPLERKENELYSYQFAWQKAITEHQYDEFMEAVSRRYNQAFKMSEISDVNIGFLENSYLQTK